MVETKTKEEATKKTPVKDGADSSAPKKTTRQATSTKPGTTRGGSTRQNRGRQATKKEGGGRRQVAPREKSEFDQKIINIRRVTRVVAGGRRFSFSVAVVLGDRNGRVGLGVDRGTDTALAIEKAVRDAKKNMVTIKRTEETHSIAHETEAKYSSTEIIIRPAPGRGIVAGSSARTVLEFAGIRDVGAKIISRSKNKINIARATIKALEKLS